MSSSNPTGAGGAPYDDDFRQLMEDTLEALDRLFQQSTPDSCIALRQGYGDLRRDLARDDLRREAAAANVARDAQAQRQHDWQEREREINRRRGGWNLTPIATREHLLLNALGDDRLTVSDLVPRLNAELGAPAGLTVVPESGVRSLVSRMHHAGELERAGEPFRGRVRYRYFRRPLDGPSADLERAFHDRSSS